jgi:hypothetical protein
MDCPVKPGNDSVERSAELRFRISCFDAASE